MPEEKVDHRLDLIGQVCPYSTVETRVTLKKMVAGEGLEVTTDFYPARQTIPDLMRGLGYSCKLVDGEKPVFRFVIQIHDDIIAGGECAARQEQLVSAVCIGDRAE